MLQQQHTTDTCLTLKNRASFAITENHLFEVCEAAQELYDKEPHFTSVAIGFDWDRLELVLLQEFKDELATPCEDFGETISYVGTYEPFSFDDYSFGINEDGDTVTVSESNLESSWSDNLWSKVADLEHDIKNGSSASRETGINCVFMVDTKVVS